MKTHYSSFLRINLTLKMPNQFCVPIGYLGVQQIIWNKNECNVLRKISLNKKGMELKLTGNIKNNNSVLTLFLNSQPNFFTYCFTYNFLKILNLE